MGGAVKSVCVAVVALSAVFAAVICQAHEKAESTPLVKVFVRGGKVFVGEPMAETPESLKLLSVETGEELTILRSDVAALKRNVSHQEALKRAGLVPYLVWRVKHARRVTPRGRVVAVTGDSAYVDLGGQGRIEVGDELNVYRGGGEPGDPETGEGLGEARTLVGKVEVIGVKEEFWEVKPRAEGAAGLQLGDLVELVVPRTVAIMPIVDTAGETGESGAAVREEWRSALVERGVSVADSAEVDHAITELGVADQERLDPDAAIRIGTALDACAVVGGVIRRGASGRASVHPQLVWVSTGKRLLANPEPLPKAVEADRAAQLAERERVITLRRKASRAAGLLALAERCQALLSASDVQGQVEVLDYGGNCYAFIPVDMTWHHARAACEQLGGHLATIANDDENVFVWARAMARRNLIAWIGCTDEVREGDWRWVDGTRVAFSCWSSGQPDNRNGEHYAVTGHGRQPLWNDQGYASHAFVCEWEGVAFQWHRPEPPSPYLFGSVGTNVVRPMNRGAGLSVWPIFPEFCGAGRYRVSIKHAIAGAQGAFYMVAWADTNGDDTPDTEIGRSDKKVASRRDEWSTWEFRAGQKGIFVGFGLERDTSFYWHDGEPGGWFGLGNACFYSGDLNQVPSRQVSPRYTNIRVAWTPE